ncbi:ATP-binding protein [Ideonella alba]|uniref:histidine kinase n=1 Tax=Ideonella alba TaxID=2824118 RepID=A0A940YF53_9BURK|nr:ATP-binding protein [Ideonella alba]MBQ0932111.1 GAF domain-containing sensor histidine kinase [Ideonella alba]
MELDDPNEAIWNTLACALEGTKADIATLYIQHLNTGSFSADFRLSGNERTTPVESRRIPAWRDEKNAAQALDTSFLRGALQKNLASWFDVIDRNRPQYIESDTESICIVPIHQLKNRSGFLVLEAKVNPGWQAHRSHYLVLQTLLSIILEKRNALRLLSTLHQPIDFLTTLDEFLDRILLVAAAASGMSHVALRELSKDRTSLRCLNAVGFEKVDDLSTLDLDPVADYPSFQRAIDGVTVSEPDMSAPHLRKLSSNAILKGIQSFVIAPVKVGTEVFGTLSFAASIPHTYSVIELAGFEAIANAVGVALSNQRNSEQLSLVTESHVQTGMTFTALEVAQAARHEAREHVDNAQTALASIKLTSQRIRDSKSLLETIDRCTESITQIGHTIDKIKDASKVRKGERSVQSVQAVWKQSVGLVSGRLRAMNVNCRMTRDIELPIFPELMRILFANLLLNSLDAFDRRGRSRAVKPSITLFVEDSPVKSNVQILRYVDNAGGLDHAALKSLISSDAAGNPDKGIVTEMIFERGITTKEKGTGYGLYIARRAAAEHKGSIRLHDSRDGVVFDIELPKEA